MSARSGVRVQVVTVSFNSARTLRGCVEPLAAMADVRVTVVDNASTDGSLETIADLPVDAVRASRNDGFAAGCNLGIERGSAPYVLLLNPDARLGRADLQALVAALDADPGIGLVAPRILESDGRLSYSQRRFPRLRSTYAQALFLHRLWPQAPWVDELVRDRAAYERSGSPDWVSGACMLLRRSALWSVGGLDEDFFLYCEDIDLCARLRRHGYRIRFEAGATARHEGGASTADGEAFAILARNRVLYARKHARPSSVPLEALGVALGHATHALTSIARPPARRGHLRALAAAIAGSATVGGAQGGRR